MNHITKADCRVMRDAIQNALVVTAKELGVVIKVGACKFTSANADFKLEVATIGKGGEVATRESQDFKLYATSYGLRPTDLGKTFVYGGEGYIVTGLKPRKQKYAICATNTRTKKSFGFPADVVKQFLGTETK